MTRLQKAKKQLSEALVALESAVEQASSAPPSTSMNEKRAGENLSADMQGLLDEVSIIETKLNEAISLIARMEASASADGDAE